MLSPEWCFCICLLGAGLTIVGCLMIANGPPEKSNPYDIEVGAVRVRGIGRPMVGAMLAVVGIAGFLLFIEGAICCVAQAY